MTTKKAYRYDPSASYTVREYDVEYLRVGGVTRQVRIYQPEGPWAFPHPYERPRRGVERRDGMRP